MKSNFGAVLWIIWMVIFVAVSWKERNTVPLRRSGNPLVGLLFVGGLIAVGTVYVWWANRRDSK